MKKQFNEDEEAKRLIKKLELDQPSENFTSKVMDSILAMEAGKKITTEYKPLIGIRGWIAIAASFIGLILITSFSTENSMSRIPGYLEQMNRSMSWIGNIEVPSASPMLLIIIMTCWGLYLIDKYLFSFSRI